MKNYLKPFKEWTTTQLETELQGIEQSIKVAGYGTKDLLMRNEIEQELDRRAYEERYGWYTEYEKQQFYEYGYVKYPTKK